MLSWRLLLGVEQVMFGVNVGVIMVVIAAGWWDGGAVVMFGWQQK